MLQTVQDVVGNLIDGLAQLEEDINTGKPNTEWEYPWKTLSNMPTNFTTKKNYHGFNIFCLAMAGREKSWTVPKWAGYRQWNVIGKPIQRTELKSGVGILVPTKKKYTIIENGKEIEKLSQRFTYKHVYNIAQTQGFDPNVEIPDSPAKFNTKHTDNLIRKHNLKIQRGTCAAYHRNNVVEMPPYNRFKSDDQYYHTLFHELIHWTGHKDRLNRDMINNYAFEELVAEIGSTFVSSFFGLDWKMRDDHIKYIHGWMKSLKDKPNRLITATNLASRASEFLINEMEVSNERK